MKIKLNQDFENLKYCRLRNKLKLFHQFMTLEAKITETAEVNIKYSLLGIKLDYLV